MPLQARVPEEGRDAGSWGQAQKDPRPPEPSEGARPCRHLSVTCGLAERPGHISAVVSHRVGKQAGPEHGRGEAGGPAGRESGGSGTSSPHNVQNNRTRPRANNRVCTISYQQWRVWLLWEIRRPAPRASVIPPPSCTCSVAPTALRWPRGAQPGAHAGAQCFPHRWTVWAHNQASNNRDTF